jgi:hypothetical protein
VKLHPHPHGVFGLSEEILLPGSWASGGGSYVTTFLEASSRRAHSSIGACFSCRRDGGRRGSDFELMMFGSGGSGLEPMVGSCFMW